MQSLEDYTTLRKIGDHDLTKGIMRVDWFVENQGEGRCRWDDVAC